VETKVSKPYYEHDGITIYHGDCRDILPSLVFDLVLTDPPYGISYDSSHKKYKGGISRDKIVGDDKLFDPGHLVNHPAIIWGGNCFASRLPDSPVWLAWIKTRRDDAKIRQADMELAWTNCIVRSRVFHHLWIGAYKDSESGIRNFHPTQKPLVLMRWCLSLVQASVILDPYCGSGTTLVAAKEKGLQAIGIEIEEKYCEITAKRLSQEILL
jgi:DNA modification methylase